MSRHRTDPRRAAAALTACLLAAAPAAAQNQLRLGYYVQAGSTCAEASNATLVLVHWSGINVSRVACDFVESVPLAENIYGYRQSCTEIASGSRFETEGSIRIPGPEAFDLASESGQSSYRFCPQSSLPEPWRSNDISGFVR